MGRSWTKGHKPRKNLYRVCECGFTAPDGEEFRLHLDEVATAAEAKAAKKAKKNL